MAGEATTNYGFLGEVTSAQTPQVLAKGAKYGIVGPSALKATVGIGDRAVAIAAGTAWGDGVLSKWAGPVTLQGTTVSSGSRWDTVVIRRTWQPTLSPTGVAQLRIIVGGTDKQVAVSRTTDAGVTTSEQPIALVRFTAGLLPVQEIIDLRCWADNGGMTAASVEALQYLADAGSSVRVGNMRYDRMVDLSTGAMSWERNAAKGVDRVESGPQMLLVADDGTTAMRLIVDNSNNTVRVERRATAGGTWSTLMAVGTQGIVNGVLPYSSLTGETVGAPATIASGWQAPTADDRTLNRRGKTRELELYLARTGGAIAVGSDGGFADTLLATLAVGDRPRAKLVPVVLVYKNAAGSTIGGVGYINGAGNIYLAHGAVGQPLGQLTTTQIAAGSRSLYMFAEWSVA